MIERALIVDSHVSSRRTLARDVAEYQIANSIVEADSVRDGLQQLKYQPFGACFLGAKLQPATALGFIEAGRTCALQEDCAFLLVMEKRGKVSDHLYSIADATIEFPYSKEIFTEIVNKTVEKNSARAQSRIEARELSLSQALDGLAGNLRDIAQGLMEGKLTLQRDGTPSAPTDYAFKKAVEQYIPASSANGSRQADEFLELISTWFTKRARNEHHAVLETLRKKLF